MSTRSRGTAGEESAAQYLTAHGFTVLGRNVYVGHLEIDILARDDSHLIFAEVKTRRQYPGTDTRFGRPADSVDAKKRARLMLAVQSFLREHPDEYAGLIPNIDIIEVYLDPSPAAVYRVLDIRHFRNAVNGM
jgi:putative endonuclease